MLSKTLLICILTIIGTVSSVFSQLPGYLPEDGLVAWWPFCGNAHDESGNQYHGVVDGAQLTTDRYGYLSSAYYFDGVDDQIVIDDLCVDMPEDAISISVWVNAHKAKTQSLFQLANNSQTNRVLVHLHWQTQKNTYWDYGNIFDNGRLHCDVESSKLNEWEHYVFVGETKSNKLEIYLNGNLVCSKYNAKASFMQTVTDFWIGGGQVPGNIAYFNGLIDDFGIWNRVLNHEEILNLYNADPYFPCYPLVDLDKDNSSGDSTINWIETSYCDETTWPICDEDVFITLQYGIDSIQVKLNNTPTPSEDSFQFTTVDSVSILVHSNHYLTLVPNLVNPGKLTWENALKNIQLHHSSGIPPSGDRVVTVDLWRNNIKSETAFATIKSITQPNPLSFTFNQHPASCEGKQDGSVWVIPNGGTPPYTFLWNDPLNTSHDTLGPIAAGIYTVTVTDQNNCTSVLTIRVDEIQIPCDCAFKLGNYVWYDFNRNGIQDNNEKGRNGIPVHLVQPGPDGLYGTDDDDIIKSTITNGSGFETGYYLFDQVCTGTYAICFDIDTLEYGFTYYRQGIDPTKDSDAQLTNGCTPSFTITSTSEDDYTWDAGIHEICRNFEHGGTIGEDQTLCQAGSIPDLIYSIEEPAGGYGNSEYLWFWSDIDPNKHPGNSNWQEIPNSNSPEYQSGPLSKTTYFIRYSRRSNCRDWIISNVVTITIIDTQAAILTQYGGICVNQKYLFIAKTLGQNATYNWAFEPDGIPATANGVNVNNIYWPTQGNKKIKLQVSFNGCLDSIEVAWESSLCANKSAFNDLKTELTSEDKVIEEWSSDVWEQEMDQKIILYPNEPNPFSDHTKIEFYLSEDRYVRLSIGNINGSVLHTQEGYYTKGRHTVLWQPGWNIRSGLVYCHLESGEISLTRIMEMHKY